MTLICLQAQMCLKAKKDSSARTMQCLDILAAASSPILVRSAHQQIHDVHGEERCHLWTTHCTALHGFFCDLMSNWMREASLIMRIPLPGCVWEACVTMMLSLR